MCYAERELKKLLSSCRKKKGTTEIYIDKEAATEFQVDTIDDLVDKMKELKDKIYDIQSLSALDEVTKANKKRISEQKVNDNLAQLMKLKTNVGIQDTDRNPNHLDSYILRDVDNPNTKVSKFDPSEEKELIEIGQPKRKKNHAAQPL